jgi:acyl-coenzyme A thioesterase PaaI-like protein
MTEAAAGRERLPYHGPCFICGPDNPDGMGLDWYAEGGRVFATFRFAEAQQGPRNHAHGGAAAAVLDEAMGAAVWTAGHRVLAANLNVDFRAPVPLDVEVEVEAWVAEVIGRKARAVARLTLPGSSQPLVEATGLFVAVPDFFAPGGAGAIDPDADSWSSHTGPES